MADTLTGSMLTLAGALDVVVIDGSWVRRADFRIGARVRTKDGTLRSSEAGTAAFPYPGSKKIFDCQIDLYDQAEEDAVRAACPIGDAITVTGYLIPGGTLSAVVDIGDVATVTAIIDGDTTILRTASLHIEEV